MGMSVNSMRHYQSLLNENDLHSAHCTPPQSQPFLFPFAELPSWRSPYCPKTVLPHPPPSVPVWRNFSSHATSVQSLKFAQSVNLNFEIWDLRFKMCKNKRSKNIVVLKISQNPTLTDSPALKQSLFSHVPPTINFMLHNEMSAHQLHNDLRKHLKWKLSTITPAIVKRCARLDHI